MEIKDKFILFVFLLSVCYTKEDIYNIKFYGVNVAKCYIATQDTIVDDVNCLKINYKVHSTSIMNLFFNVNNTYETILNKNTMDIMYYKKETTQPNVDNKLETVSENNFVQYKYSDYKINKGEVNIFSLLYLLTIKNDIDYLNKLILDREGKKYFCDITLDSNDFIYYLDFKPKNINDFGLIKHTDIFTWALFLDNTIKVVKISSSDNNIEYCKFKKGLINFEAKKVETN